jgi:hypothetical protein
MTETILACLVPVFPVMDFALPAALFTAMAQSP